MQVLSVGDLHYDLRKLDWVLSRAADVDLLVVAGDLLDIGSALPLDSQIAVTLEYLERMARRTTVVVCSGNHDLDHRTDNGEKATAWLSEARDVGVVVDGDTIELDGWQVSACAWWEGPTTLQQVEAALDAVDRTTALPWMWVWHGPPDGPLAWTGSKTYGDPELPRLIEHHRPDVVLCGHVHEAPFVSGGAWSDRVGTTWVFNAGRQIGPIPSHVELDLGARGATWWSFDATGSVSLDQAAAPTAAP